MLSLRYPKLTLAILFAAMLAAQGCEFRTVQPPPPLELSSLKQCSGLPHDDRVMCEYCTKHPKICAAR